MHIPDAKRNKFDKKSAKCVFDGYLENTKGFKQYNLEKKAFSHSRDVIFEKRKFHEFKSKDSFEFYCKNDDNKTTKIDAIINKEYHTGKTANEKDHPEDPMFQYHRPVGATYADNFLRDMERLDVQRFKGRLVTQGYTHLPGIDYEEVL
ncbi:uncharacterized protein LOC124449124 [Xenia sp. Carnegie-2017]|uniref:uncharacterized protein LOC124449124 n=1 Tax=Xenia sp. Carnegie-2017 TaxID=2897299 RepID=UPI001F03ADE1|nr:uncharacterized protein LOC124449124 [Xenia sp. Carnegie-2017]